LKRLKAQALAAKARLLALLPVYTARQRECLAAIERLRAQGHPVPKVLYGGARGGGKSYLGCRRAIELAEEHPGIRGYLCRAEAVTFKRTTLVTLLDKVEVLSRPGWSIRTSDQYLLHANGSRLDYGGLASNEDRDKLKSMELTFGFVDEASDVDPASARMLEGSCRRQPAFAELSFVLYASNPEPCWLQSDFIDDVKPGRAYVPALPADNPYLDPLYVEHLRETYAELPEMLDAYVNGSWGAIGSSDKVFPAALVAAAMKRECEPGTPVQWGVDVARFGDDHTVVYERRGLATPRLVEEWTKQDTRTTSDKLIALYGAADPKPAAIAIDDIGVGGGVTDNLRAAHLPVRPINVGEAARESGKYANKRAELAMHLRSVLEGGGCLPQDEQLRSELTACRYYVRSGHIALEGKDELKKRLGRSPDHADAVILAFAPLRTGPTPGAWAGSMSAHDMFSGSIFSGAIRGGPPPFRYDPHGVRPRRRH
jgi:phage terminase large subunit